MHGNRGVGKPDSDNRARLQFGCHVGCCRTAAPSHDLRRRGANTRLFHAGIESAGPVDGQATSQAESLTTPELSERPQLAVRVANEFPREQSRVDSV